jgi:hypothetical protein
VKELGRATSQRRVRRTFLTVFDRDFERVLLIKNELTSKMNSFEVSKKISQCVEFRKGNLWLGGCLVGDHEASMRRERGILCKMGRRKWRLEIAR